MEHQPGFDAIDETHRAPLRAVIAGAKQDTDRSLDSAPVERDPVHVHDATCRLDVIDKQQWTREAAVDDPRQPNASTYESALSARRWHRQWGCDGMHAGRDRGRDTLLAGLIDDLLQIDHGSTRASRVAMRCE